MQNLVKFVKAYIESQGKKCNIQDGHDDVLWMGFRTDNIEAIKIYMIFDKEREDFIVSFKAFNVCKFPAEKTELMYKVCSQMNRQYRWVKFYVDESDNTITCQDDAMIQLETAGKECLDLVARMVQICDTVYPELMKAIWR